AKPAIVLTDANVGHVDDVPAPPAAAPAGGPAAAAKLAAPAERLVIGEWHQDHDASKGGATLVGQVTNVSADLVQDVRLKVSLHDEKGELIADANALVGATTLLPGQSTNFRATFPGVLHYVSTKFATEGYARKVATAPAPGT
ncbi:MAG TPA: FxLYD domain-containing protein, partial [Thermoanaerobaculia bacterium]|nr:FxLYD domain-containing protein [Thermoanaerobaculia bacterium]